MPQWGLMSPQTWDRAVRPYLFKAGVTPIQNPFWLVVRFGMMTSLHWGGLESDVGRSVFMCACAHNRWGLCFPMWKGNPSSLIWDLIWDKTAKKYKHIRASHEHCVQAVQINVSVTDLTDIVTHTVGGVKRIPWKVTLHLKQQGLVLCTL